MPDPQISQRKLDDPERSPNVGMIAAVLLGSRSCCPLNIEGLFNYMYCIINLLEGYKGNEPTPLPAWPPPGS